MKILFRWLDREGRASSNLGRVCTLSSQFMVLGNLVRGDPRRSLGFLRDTYSHECRTSCDPNCSPHTKVSLYVLEEHVDSHLDGWDDGGSCEVGGTPWKTMIHPEAG